MAATRARKRLSPKATLVPLHTLVTDLFINNHEQSAGVSPLPHEMRCSLRTRQSVESLPQELIDRIIDWTCPSALTEKDSATASACSLVKSSWTRRSQQHLFRTVVLDPDRLVCWCKNIPASPTGPSSFVDSLLLKKLTADHLIEHIEHIKSFEQVTRLNIQYFHGETFDGEKIERCFAHFGSTVQFLSLVMPLCQASLFPHMLNLLVRAIHIDITTPYTTPNIYKTEYKPLPNLESLRLRLGRRASIDYKMFGAFTNLRKACICHPSSASRVWFNSLFAQCADTLESLYIGPEVEGQSKRPSHPHAGVLLWTQIGADNISLVPDEAISSMPDDIPQCTRWSIASCENIRHIEVPVEPREPGALAQQIITSAPVTNLRSIGLFFDTCEMEGGFGSQAGFEAWEALENHLCYVADMKLKKNPPEEFTVMLFINPYGVGSPGGGEDQLWKFMDGLQKRGVLEIKSPWSSLSEL